MINYSQQNSINQTISEMESLGEVFFTVHQIAAFLGNAIDARVPFTGSHSKQVADLSRCLAIKAGFSTRQAEIIHIAGHVHDIGKIGIPDEILSKNGPLTDREWKMIWLHPVIGARIVAPLKFLGGIAGISRLILHHHERFDGKGYPDGLKADKIPPGARVLALADSLSTMLQDRPHHGRLSLSQAMDRIRQGSGTKFDPILSAILLDMLEAAGPEFEMCGLSTLVEKVICRRVTKNISCKGCSKARGPGSSDIIFKPADSGRSRNALSPMIKA
jgi:HD-GYP domain-containing protein (c-di-GMP phosphodiesterase class II)